MSENRSDDSYHLPLDPAEGLRMFPSLTPAAFEHWRNLGLNQRQIARLYGVTPQAVSNMRARHKTSDTPREGVKRYWPWRTSWKYTRGSLYHRLRDHAEYKVTRSGTLSPNKLYQLMLFYRLMERTDTVVDFDPAIEPYEGCQSGGWVLVPRQSTDGDLIIRVTDRVNVPVDDRFRAIWSWPKKIPDAQRSETGRK